MTKAEFDAGMFELTCKALPKNIWAKTGNGEDDSFLIQSEGKEYFEDVFFHGIRIARGKKSLYLSYDSIIGLEAER